MMLVATLHSRAVQRLSASLGRTASRGCSFAEAATQVFPRPAPSRARVSCTQMLLAVHDYGSPVGSGSDDQ
jgi:hypothetical protein